MSAVWDLDDQELAYRTRKIMRMYEWLFTQTESFEEIGEDLVYLMAAVIKGHECEFDNDNYLVELLRGNPVIWAEISPSIILDNENPYYAPFVPY